MRNEFCIKKILTALCITIKISCPSFANTVLVDKIVAKVGNQPILLSEVESIYIQVVQQKNNSNEMSKQEILEKLIESKLLISQAKKEGAIVNEDRLNQELNYRIEYLVDRLGSVSRVEDYFNKSLYNIKIDFKKQIQEQILAEEVRHKVISNVQITPGEVSSFFSSLSSIDIPIYPAEYVVYELIKKVMPSEAEVKSIEKILTDYKSKVEAGEDFEELISSEQYDYATKLQCAPMSWVIGSSNAPEYESEVVALSPGTISQPIIGAKGVYLVKVITKKLTKIDVIQVYALYNSYDTDLQHTKDILMKIRADILNKKITLEEAKSQSYYCGEGVEIIIDDTKSKLEDLPTDVFYTIEDNDMQSGDVSEPIVCSEKTNDYFEVKLIYLKDKVPCRKATLERDYEKISELCLAYKRADLLKAFLEKVKKNTSVWIDKLQM